MAAAAPSAAQEVPGTLSRADTQEILTREKEIQAKLVEVLRIEAIERSVPGCEVSKPMHTAPHVR